jgi:integrase
MAKLTDKVVKGLKKNAPKVGHTITWDDDVTGFGARVTANGATSFVLEYRAPVPRGDGEFALVGTKRRYTIRRYPEWSVEKARDEAKKLLMDALRKGVDPLEARGDARRSPTIEEICDVYLNSTRFQRKRSSSQQNERGMIEKNIKPALGKLRAVEITQRHIEKLHGGMKPTPYMANRVLALLSIIFGEAIRDGVVSENPTRGVERYHEEKREAWLTVEQMRALDTALNEYGKRNLDGANLLRLCILTGARVGEVVKADWSEFELERGVWTKPSAHTKQKRTATIPLNDTALAVLRSMRPEGTVVSDKKGEPLFPYHTEMNRNKKLTKDGTTKVVHLKKSKTPAHRTSYKNAWLQVCALAGLAEKYEVPSKWMKGRRAGQPRINKETGLPIMLTRWRPTHRVHDLRHAYASFLISNGVPLQVVGSLLGHTQASTTQRYAHAHDDARRAATNKIADILPFTKVG